MPVVQYIFDGKDQTKNMLTPKRITSLPHWYKEARKAIPDIPLALFDVFGDNEWMVEYSEVDVKWIKMDLLRKDGRKAFLVILRT